VGPSDCRGSPLPCEAWKLRIYCPKNGPDGNIYVQLSGSNRALWIHSCSRIGMIITLVLVYSLASTARCKFLLCMQFIIEFHMLGQPQ